jgi:hypothetical protein
MHAGNNSQPQPEPDTSDWASNSCVSIRIAPTVATQTVDVTGVSRRGQDVYKRHFD